MKHADKQTYGKHPNVAYGWIVRPRWTDPLRQKQVQRLVPVGLMIYLTEKEAKDAAAVSTRRLFSDGYKHTHYFVVSKAVLRCV